MGPRPEGRGNVAVAVLALVLLGVLQWGRIPMDAETERNKHVEGRTGKLQWGRIPTDAETP